MKLPVDQVLDRLATATIILAALVVAGSIAYRTFRPPAAHAASVKPQFVPQWTDGVRVGHQFGTAGAPVTLIEVADLQCPVCRDFYLRTLHPYLLQHPNLLSVVHVSYPLPYHRGFRHETPWNLRS